MQTIGCSCFAIKTKASKAGMTTEGPCRALGRVENAAMQDSACTRTQIPRMATRTFRFARLSCSPDRTRTDVRMHFEQSFRSAVALGRAPGSENSTCLFSALPACQFNRFPPQLIIRKSVLSQFDLLSYEKKGESQDT